MGKSYTDFLEEQVEKLQEKLSDAQVSLELYDTVNAFEILKKQMKDDRKYSEEIRQAMFVALVGKTPLSQNRSQDIVDLIMAEVFEVGKGR
jgi:hypothetical protein